MRISLTGTHGAGKTTLLHKLSLFYQVPIVQEYARDILERYDRHWIDMNVTERLCLEAGICNAQFYGLSSIGTKFISDRLPIDIDAYMSLTYKEHKQAIDESESLIHLYWGTQHVSKALTKSINFDIIIYLRDFDRADWRASYIDEYIDQEIRQYTCPILELKSKNEYYDVTDVVQQINLLME